MKTKINLVFLIIIFWSSGYSQTENTCNNKLTQEELTNYEKQARQLVSFMEFAFNTLGSDKSEYKDKHTIIEQSYLKFFKDDKVQIEDDLVEKRDVVTNKDVQAYLKDIDFFFKNVTFKYTIEEISQEVNESGDIFFRIKASRNLKGKTLDNKEINDTRPRYIEINLDESTRDFKIVSVYTTKSNEEQELIAWWNGLDRVWRTFLAGDSKVNDSVYLKDIILIHNDYVIREIIYANYNDSLIDTDTITVNEARVLPEVRRILRADEIDISGLKGIYDIKPLYAFSGLKHLNISNARIPDLDPIRNLSKLETLIASRSLIISLEPIRYIPQMQTLDISGTLISDISPLEAFTSLEVLNLSGSRVTDLRVLNNLTELRELNLSNLPLTGLNIQPVSNLKTLEVLELSGMPIDSLAFVEGLNNLKRFSVEGTGIRSLKGVENLNLLEVIFFDNTQVNSLEQLSDLPALKIVYCDKTNIDSRKALAFMQSRPDVRVIYESQELMAWWQKLPDEWKSIFSALTELSDAPTREQLHEVSFIKSLDISNNVLINDISPLTEISSLNVLNISGSGVKDISALSGLFNLNTLNISRTRIADLSPIAGLTGLTEIDFSLSAVTSIKPLSELPNLRTIGMDSTNVTDPQYLAKMQHLATVFADGVISLPALVSNIMDSIPDILIVYQTKALSDWWNGLSSQWKEVFSSYEPVSQMPDRIQLHKIANLKEIDISNKKEINNLTPLSTLKRLQVLNASNMQLSDLTPLAITDRLRIVDISNTPVTDLSPISNHKLLEDFNCANSPVSDLSPLSWHLSLKRLNISGTQVTKLDVLETCSNLEELICFNTRINSVKPLDELTKISLLRAYNTKLSERKIAKFKELHPSAEVVYY
ncbi:MAG TPA: leucine-rich repeat domain-containing protein [Lentimicrobium sp.]|nr:leucine-rich repeat domain-containing protein [Lentimicrobium sp.]